jgi:hypothetical protein
VYHVAIFAITTVALAVVTAAKSPVGYSVQETIIPAGIASAIFLLPAYVNLCLSHYKVCRAAASFPHLALHDPRAGQHALGNAQVPAIGHIIDFDATRGQLFARSSFQAFVRREDDDIRSVEELPALQRRSMQLHWQARYCDQPFDSRGAAGGYGLLSSPNYDVQTKTVEMPSCLAIAFPA